MPKDIYERQEPRRSKLEQQLAIRRGQLEVLDGQVAMEGAIKTFWKRLKPMLREDAKGAFSLVSIGLVHAYVKGKKDGDISVTVVTPRDPREPR